MGPGTVLGGYPGSTPPGPPTSHTPGTPPPRRPQLPATRAQHAARLNSAVGLNLVDQLSLSGHFSGFSLMTEVYNLVVAGNANDHKSIPQNE